MFAFLAFRCLFFKKFRLRQNLEKECNFSKNCSESHSEVFWKLIFQIFSPPMELGGASKVPKMVLRATLRSLGSLFSKIFASCIRQFKTPLVHSCTALYQEQPRRPFSIFRHLCQTPVVHQPDAEPLLILVLPSRSRFLWGLSGRPT